MRISDWSSDVCSSDLLYSIGFTHDGQTEFVAERCGIAGGNVAMMMVGPSLRTVPLTIHTPIAQVPGLLTIELIVSRVRTVNRGLQRDFGLACSRLAIAGLTPPAGETGNMGKIGRASRRERLWQ